MDRVERTFYPDGTLEKEVHFFGTKENGPWRRWHPNGVLAEEYFFEHGVYVNTINRSWDEHGMLRSEHSILNGSETGRLTVWDQDGSIIYRHFALDGRKVSRAMYEEACKGRPELPRYKEDEPPRAVFRRPSQRTSKNKREAAPRPLHTSRASEESKVDSYANIFHDKLLASPKAEALQWLNSSNQRAARSLGEMHFEEAVFLVTNLYEYGAIEVIAVEIETTPGTDDQTTNHLLVRLPTEPAGRERLFSLENEHADSKGFDGETDHGQSHLYFKLC